MVCLAPWEMPYATLVSKNACYAITIHALDSQLCQNQNVTREEVEGKLYSSAAQLRWDLFLVES